MIAIKDYLYLAVIVAILSAVGVYAHHERVVQAAKDAAADARVAQAAVVHNQEIEDAASKRVDAAVQAYAASVAAPPVPTARIVCHSEYPPAGGPVPTHAPAATPSDAAQPATAEAGPGFDPAPAVLADGRDAEAQLVLLQAYVKACQDAGLCEKGPS